VFKDWNDVLSDPNYGDLQFCDIYFLRADYSTKGLLLDPQYGFQGFHWDSNMIFMTIVEIRRYV